jgi:hypothetical protein
MSRLPNVAANVAVTVLIAFAGLGAMTLLAGMIAAEKLADHFNLRFD